MCVALRDWALQPDDIIGHKSAIEWRASMAAIGADPREARPIKMLRDEQGRPILISRSAAARRDAGGANLSCTQTLLVPLEWHR